MSVVPTGQSGADVLAPHWLSSVERGELRTTIRRALATGDLHPVVAIHLEDVLTELHVAAARDAVWPAPAARVRLATGWSADVLPVRLSEAELSGVLALPTLPAALRARLGAGGA